jgi:hypothetical protein
MIRPTLGKALRALGALGERLAERGLMARRPVRQSDDFQWRKGASGPRGRVEANGTVIGDRLYLFGGYETLERVWDWCDVYDLRQDRWVDSIPTPPGMAQTHAGLTSDAKRFVYVLGGQFGPHCGPCVDRCYSFDVESKTFREFPPLPAPRYVAVAEYWNARVHVVGGSLPDRFTPAT